MTSTFLSLLPAASNSSATTPKTSGSSMTLNKRLTALGSSRKASEDSRKGLPAAASEEKEIIGTSTFCFFSV